MNKCCGKSVHAQTETQTETQKQPVSQPARHRHRHRQAQADRQTKWPPREKKKKNLRELNENEVILGPCEVFVPFCIKFESEGNFLISTG